MIAADILIPSRTVDAPAALAAVRGAELPDFAGVLAARLAVTDGAEALAAAPQPTVDTATPAAADLPASADILAGLALSDVLPPDVPSDTPGTMADPAVHQEPAPEPAPELVVGLDPEQTAAPVPVAAETHSEPPAALSTAPPPPPQEAVMAGPDLSPTAEIVDVPQTGTTTSALPTAEDATAAATASVPHSSGETVENIDADARLPTSTADAPSRPKQSKPTDEESEASPDDAKPAQTQDTVPMQAVPPPQTMATQAPIPLPVALGNSPEGNDLPIETEKTPGRPTAKTAKSMALADPKGADPQKSDTPVFRDIAGDLPRPTVLGKPTEQRPTPGPDQPEDITIGTAPAQAMPPEIRSPNSPQPQLRPVDTQPIDTTRQGWEVALAERITTRETDIGQEIEITLTPDSLGTVKIKLDLSDKLAAVQIVTDTPQAAQLFQQSETRLAEAFSRAGLTLTSHDAASRDAAGRDSGQRQSSGGQPRNDAGLASLRGSFAPPQIARHATNLINIVA